MKASGGIVLLNIRLVICLIMLSQPAWAETITTTDGRMIELSSDGTYKFLPNKSASPIQMVEKTPFFMRFAGDYNQNSVRFMPIFKNETGKTVVGFKFVTDFRSAFGEEIFSFNGESSERIADGATSTASTFYFFEDNQFIANEPYDQLNIFEAAKTGTIKTTVTAVVFDGGEVIKANP